MPSRCLSVVLTVAAGLCVCHDARGQTAQKGIELLAKLRKKLDVEYVGYRAARCETEAVTEVENERPNKGGLVYVYLRNTSRKPVQLAFYRYNRKDESHWMLGAYLAWHRIYDKHLAPGELTVQELNGVTEDFGPDRPFTFQYVDRSWLPACHHKGMLREDPVQISLLRVLPGRDALEVHVRHRGKGKVALLEVGVEGRKVTEIAWVGEAMSGPSHAIARVRLDKPLDASQLVVAKVTLDDGAKRTIYAHRRAFVDWFPIGCWSVKPNTYALLPKLHIQLVVQGGTAENPFYKEVAAKHGYRTMCPTGKFDGIDTIRSLADHPAVACWMLSDEPDWSTPAVVMVYSDAFVRKYNKTRPTFITLCRNVKFFEYGTIADIPCMDHYCVTAPSSSKWPKPYGTRLEETAYYTRDLKAACEPKPIWVWSQGIAGWDERPKRPVPTPDELASQLVFNLGRGAKGIIWFNYQHEVAEKYPDARRAIQRWGRVIKVVRDDLLAGEPVEAGATAPEKVDVATLASWDTFVMCANNLDYDIHPQAYPFRTRKDVKVSARLPDWIKPKAALLVSPDGIERVPFKVSDGRVEVDFGDLRVCKIIVLTGEAGQEQAYRAAYAKALAAET